MSALRRRSVLHILVFLSSVTVACSSSGGNGDYEPALREYEQVVMTESEKLAAVVTPALIQEFSAVGTEGGQANDTQALFGVISKFRDQGTASGETMCTAFKRQAEKAGSGKSRDDRLANAREQTRKTLLDTMSSALINQVVAAPPERQTTLFNQLGVLTTSTDGRQLTGTEALQTLGLLDASGKAALPTRGTQQYEDFERWLLAEGKGFSTAAGGLIGKTVDVVDDCKTEDE
jgi:hypothetical protein